MQISVGLLALTILCPLLFFGCAQESRPTKVAERADSKASAYTKRSAAPRIESNAPSLTKYQQNQNDAPPKNWFGEAKQNETKKQTTPESIRFVVTVEGVSNANGGTAADYPGLEPNERFFKASFIKPDEPEDSRSAERKLRLKTKNPKRLMNELGRPIEVSGYWVNHGQYDGRRNTGLKLPTGTRLGRRNGEDLVEMARREQARFVRQATGQSQDESLSVAARPKRDERHLSLPPLFFVETYKPLRISRFKTMNVKRGESAP
ncbi:MAG: hypothetical protein ACON3Z_17770 [Bradymonadia bacterium]